MFNPELIGDNHTMVRQGADTLAQAPKPRSGGSQRSPVSLSAIIQPLFPAEIPELALQADNIPFDVSLLALSSIPGAGRRTLAGLVDAFSGNLSLVWRTSFDEIHAILAKTHLRVSQKFIDMLFRDAGKLVATGEAKVRELKEKGIRVIDPSSLPDRLSSIPDRPRWLFVQGNQNVLYHPVAVAVVGTRHPSGSGRRAAHNVLRMMGPYPIVLVSGLAEGIDEEAHRASLYERTANLAFLGHGINVTFPASTAWIRQQIIDLKGAVASEYLPDEHYQKSFFVERNRLQAAIASCVIPVEAGVASGTAHTIRFANKYGRSVVGVRWKNSDGLITELVREGRPIIDIFTQEGCKRLDLIFQELVRSAGLSPAPLSIVERYFIADLKRRNVPAEEIQRLMRRLAEIAREASGGQNA